MTIHSGAIDQDHLQDVRRETLSTFNEIAAHLSFAAGKIGQVIIAMDGSVGFATLCFPRCDDTTIDLLFETPQPPVQTQAPLKVHYHYQGTTYHFFSTLIRCTSDRGWRLTFPVEIDCHIGRHEDRYLVHSSPDFVLLLDTGTGSQSPVPIHDISTRGLSFLSNAKRFCWSIEEQLIATLCLPGNHMIPVCLRVVHSRAHTSSLPMQLTGCQIIGIGPLGASRLDQAISRLHRPTP